MDSDRWARRLDPELGEAEASASAELPREEELALARIAGTLRDDAMWSGPSPAVREALLAVVSADAAAGAGPAAAARRRSRVRARRAYWLSAAAVAVLLVCGFLLRPHAQGPAASFSASGTSPGSKVSAVVQLRPKPAGVAIRLIIKGLPPAPAGSYYAAWVRGPAGTVPIGTFHWHVGGHPVDLWSGVDYTRYPELFVTLQHEGDDPGPSGPTVLDGTLPSS